MHALQPECACARAASRERLRHAPAQLRPVRHHAAHPSRARCAAGTFDGGPPKHGADAAVERAVLSWLDTFIIGLDLCPFARGARRGTRVAVCRAPATEGALDELWAEMRVLHGALAAHAAVLCESERELTLTRHTRFLHGAASCAAVRARHHAVRADTALRGGLGRLHVAPRARLGARRRRRRRVHATLTRALTTRDPANSAQHRGTRHARRATHACAHKHAHACTYTLRTR
jgi:hypothetical protein